VSVSTGAGGVPEPTPYERMGGAPAFAALVRAFYLGVAGDPVLRALYPDADLEPAERRLRMFLEQYWGGPTTYQQERGHPRLRMRHFPFAIGDAEAEAWYRNMAAAVATMALDDVVEPVLLEYFERAANAMINVER